MSKQKHLERLIAAMTRGEKRHFRNFAARHVLQGQNNYLKLFDALEGGDSIDLPNMTGLRSYLQRMILQSLTNVHAVDRIGLEVRGLLDQVEILHEKGLYELAGKVSRKGRKRAKEAGEPLSEIQFLRWQRRLLKALGSGGRKDEFQTLEEEEDELLEAIQHEADCIRVHDRLFLKAQRHATATTPPDFPEHLLRDHPPNAFAGAIAYHTTRGGLARFRGQLAESVHHFQQNLEVWYRFPRHIEERPARFSAALVNFLATLHRMERFEDFNREIERIRQLGTLTDASRSHIELKCTELELLLSMNIGDFGAAGEAADKLQARLPEIDHDPVRATTFRYNLAIYHLFTANHSQSLRLFKALLDIPHVGARKDLRGLARLWELALHIELENHRLLPYRLRSLKRSANKLQLPGWAAPVIKTLQKVSDTWTASGRREIFKDLLDGMEGVEAKDRTAGFVEFQLWGRSKMEGRAMQDLVGEGK